MTTDDNRPTRCECPHCHVPKCVVDGKLEEHTIGISQIADDPRSTCLPTYRCPASSAEVSAWTLVRVLQAPYEGVTVCRIIFGRSRPAGPARTLNCPRTWLRSGAMCGGEAVPDRLCANADCKKLLHTQWPVVYCCNERTLEDM